MSTELVFVLGKKLPWVTEAVISIYIIMHQVAQQRKVKNLNEGKM